MTTTKKELEQALHKAIREKDDVKVKQLVQEKGVDINCLFYGWTPLIVAVKAGNTEIAKWLIENGCKVDFIDNQKTSALEEAVTRNQVEIVQLLIEKGCIADQQLGCSGSTPLTLAVESNYKQMVQMLVKAGADVNRENSKGEFPVYICAKENYTTSLETLLEASPDLCKPCTVDHNMTSLMKAVSMGNSKIVKSLLQNECDINSRDDVGWTALRYAVADGNIKMAKLLLEKGADPHITDSDGQSLLEEARDGDDDDMIALVEGAVNT